MFYFFNIVFLLFYALMYAMFREGWRFAHDISRRAKFKGFKNYWWFEQLRDTKKIDISYHINKAFTILFALTATVVIFLGFFEFARIPIVVLVGILGAFLIPMNFYAFIHNNQKEFGKPFVVFEKRSDGTGKFHSSVLDVFWSILPIFMVLFEIFYLL